MTDCKCKRRKEKWAVHQEVVVGTPFTPRNSKILFPCNFDELIELEYVIVNDHEFKNVVKKQKQNHLFSSLAKFE